MEHLLKQLRENWLILIFLGSMIVSWTTFNTRLAQAESDIKELRLAIISIQDIKVDIAVVKEKVTSIEKQLR